MSQINPIKKIVLSEKATALKEQGKYVFMVERGATKSEIKKAVKAIYKVDPIAVATIVQKPRRTRFRGRPSYKVQDKKAIVTLKEGQKIDSVQ